MLRIALFAITGFITTFHVSLTLYIFSSFVSTLVGELYVGIAYALGALLSFFSLLTIPRIVHKLSPIRVAWAVVMLEIVALLALAFFYTTPLVAIPALLLHLTLPPLLWYTSDLILKRLINNTSNTGKIRTACLAFINLGSIASQLLMGSLLGNSEAYQLVFLLSALTLVPTILLMTLSVTGLPRVQLPHSYTDIGSTFSCLIRNTNTLKIFAIGLLLQTVFVWFVVFVPLYFHRELGIPWEELSWVFAAMLLPYVFIEPIIGFLEDTFFAEREFMAVGFLILGIATMSIPFITENSVTLLLVVIMLLTRIGAACVEATSESYFFKHMDTSDENSFSLYRSMGPLSYLIGSLFGTLLLVFLPFSYIFVVFGLIMFVGIFIALSLSKIRITKEAYTGSPSGQAFSRSGVQ